MKCETMVSNNEQQGVPCSRRYGNLHDMALLEVTDAPTFFQTKLNFNSFSNITIICQTAVSHSLSNQSLLLCIQPS
jgi:hypothetical protein